MNREIRSKIAAETLEILSAGTYRTPSGATASIAAELAAARAASRLYRPEELARLAAELFAAALQSGTFRHRFRHVELAILDGSPGQTTLRAFADVFGSRS